MRTILFLILFAWVSAIPAQAAYEAYRPKPEVDNPFEVFLRGTANGFTWPLEIGTTLIREQRAHRWVWPITYTPRLFNNIFCRSASSINDVFFLPWTAPFTDDTRPWTDGIGLPKYPWNVEA